MGAFIPSMVGAILLVSLPFHNKVCAHQVLTLFVSNLLRAVWTIGGILYFKYGPITLSIKNCT